VCCLTANALKTTPGRPFDKLRVAPCMVLALLRSQHSCRISVCFVRTAHPGGILHLSATCRGPAALFFLFALRYRYRLLIFVPEASTAKRLRPSSFFCSAAVPVAGGGGRAHLPSLRSVSTSLRSSRWPCQKCEAIVTLTNMY
jgi:hypothetical protein